METAIIESNLKDIKLYRNTKFINTLNGLTSEEINKVMDSSTIDSISTFDVNTINYIFRNSSAVIQNKLWSSDMIQRVLILGIKNIDHFVINQITMRSIENLGKTIKSQSIKKQIYKNKYFLTFITNNRFQNIYSYSNNFFRLYDIKKVFEGMISNDEFSSLPSDIQQITIYKLNSFTKEVLLPDDFRKRYDNIEIILFGLYIKGIDSSILSQLNDEELFFLDYLNTDVVNNNSLKKYLIDSIKNKGKSFEEFFLDIKKKSNIIGDKIRRYKSKHDYYYNKVDLKEKMYHILLHDNQDEIIKEKLLKYLVCLIMKDSSLNPEEMYNALKRNLNNDLLNYKDVEYLADNYDVATNDLKLTFYLKFNIALHQARYFYGITLEQLSKVNVKHINKLYKLLHDTTQDELSSMYGACIKIYFIFGYERSIEILSGKYGEYNKILFHNIAKTDISRVKMQEEGSKYIPVIDKRFVNFMFENPKNNHFIDMLNNKDSELYKNWYYFYNNYDDVLEKCHNEITLKKLVTILETDKYDVNRKIIKPDNYLLNKNSFLENIILGNKNHNSNNLVLETIVDIYTKMKKRVESSIPYIEGTANNGYKYQTMKFDDPQIFELGYKADCCIRTLDIAHNHLLHAALCRNGRMLLIYDKLGTLAAFCPLKRNGSVLILNSIECIDKNFITNGSFIADAVKEAADESVRISKESTEPIELVCIGREAYLKPKTIPFPNEYETPTIFEKNDAVYRDTDRYHRTLDIIYKDNNFSLEDIKSKDPEVSYKDPRDEVRYFNFNEDRYNGDDVISLINSINYSINRENYTPINNYFIRSVYYSKDWYIADTYKGIIGECLETDYRAKEEFDSCMNMLNKENYSMVLKK